MRNYKTLFFISVFFFTLILQTDTFAKGWLDQQYMTGNWGGHREKLHDRGFTPFANFHMSVLGNPAGGISKGLEYSGQLIAGVEFDLEKIIKIKGLSFIASGTWISGSSLSQEHIGNIFSVSDVFNLPVGLTFSSDSFRLYQLMFQQKLFEDQVLLSFGRLAIGDSFATMDILDNFTNTAFNANPGAIKFNIPSFTVDPFSNWGARIRYTPSEKYYFMGGVYSANPDVANLDNSGLDFSFDGGALFLAEFAYSPNQKDTDTGLPGDYKIGGYFDSTEIAELSDPNVEVSNNYGIYALFQQMIYLERRSSDEGLSVFSTVAFAPKEEVNTFPFFYSGGFGYKGLLPSRGKDTTVIGLLVGFFSDDLPGQNYEMIVELSYNIHVAKWLAVQPDIQYVINPNGTDDIDNALVMGVRIEADF